MSHYSSVIQANASLPLTLLSYWRLNESSGTVASDIGSRAANGTLNGGILLGQTGLIVNEASATSMTLNGTSGYISADPTGLPTGTQPWSIEAWVNMATVPGAGIHTIVEFGSGSTNHAAVLYLGSGKISTNTYAGNTVTALASAVANTTYHCIACYDGTNLRLYINGILQGTLACTPAITLSYCRIGSEDSTPDDFWAGSIQEVAIYGGAALSALQARTDFQAGLLIPTISIYSSTVLTKTAILSRYHRLGEPSGPFAVDLSSQQQTGLINGGVTLGTPGLISGDSDKSMTFDGSSGYIALPLAGLPVGNAAWSLECWCKLASIPGDSIFHVFMSFGDSATDTGGALYIKNGAFGVNTYSGAHTVSGLSPLTGIRYHLVGTYDGAGTLTLYVNGASQGSVTGLTLNIGSIFAYIGCEESPRNDFVASVIDEAGIYSAGLSLAQVQQNYQANRALALQRAMHRSFGQIR